MYNRGRKACPTPKCHLKFLEVETFLELVFGIIFVSLFEGKSPLHCLDNLTKLNMSARKGSKRGVAPILYYFASLNVDFFLNKSILRGVWAGVDVWKKMVKIQY